jgi:hypothetical protein
MNKNNLLYNIKNLMSKNKPNLDLYSDNHPETTLKNTGYKDKEKALNTLKLIRKRSLKYQFDLVNTMYNRAKYHKNITENMKEAMKVFKDWLKNYKKEKKLEDNLYKWLPLDLILKYEKLIVIYKIKIKNNFLDKLKEVDGKYYKLQYILIKNDKPDYYDYWSYRINFIKKQLHKINKNKINLFYENSKYKGLPTKEHLKLIIYGYSNFQNKL